VRLRRFVLVTATVTGALVWLALPLSPSSIGPVVPLAGLAAGIAAGIVGWSPQWPATHLGRVVLCACVAHATIGFAIQLGHNIRLFGLGAYLVLIWPGAIGVLAQLVVADCRPWHVHLGVVLAWGSLVPIITLNPLVIVAACVAVSVFTLPALVGAIVTSAVMRATRRDRVALPIARLAWRVEAAAKPPAGRCAPAVHAHVDPDHVGSAHVVVDRAVAAAGRSGPNVPAIERRRSRLFHEVADQVSRAGLPTKPP
jgi:hypothetical protein